MCIIYEVIFGIYFKSLGMDGGEWLNYLASEYRFICMTGTSNVKIIHLPSCTLVVIEEVRNFSTK